MKTLSKISIIWTFRLIAIILWTHFFANAQTISHYCRTINQDANQTSGYISFETEIEFNGEYLLRIWQCPTNIQNEYLQSYSIELNGEKLYENITPATEGWGFLYSEDPITLNKGTQQIKIQSNLPSIPNVEFVEFIPISDSNALQSKAESKYIKYIDEINKRNSRKALGDFTIDPNVPKDTVSIYTEVDTSLIPKVPYAYDFRKFAWFGYTFYTNVYFYEGQTITCSSSTLDKTSHFIELFSATDPYNHSWSELSGDNGTARISTTITESGLYYVKVRPFKNGSTGICNLNINNNLYYNNVPICTTGISGNFHTSTDNYNIFTCNSTGNPFLWVNAGGTYDGKVTAFNDDYQSKGSLNWGNDARLNDVQCSTIKNILVSSKSSSDPIGRCELYIGCEDFRTGPNSMIADNPFPFMKPDDSMVSAPKTKEYNCFAWSGGIHTTFEVPFAFSSPYYVEGGTALDAFDNYYGSERYPGCTKYTRKNDITLTANGGIDLWSANNGAYFTHASICKSSDGNHHGYDWESKLGSDIRIFHARYALEHSTYGSVIYHYIPIGDTTARISLEESLADGAAVMDNIQLSDYQEDFLNSKISLIAPNKSEKFNLLYNEWQNTFDNTIFSNWDMIKGSYAYSSLIEACTADSELILFVYDKINKGICSAIPLFEDLFINKSSQNVQRLKNIRLNNTERTHDTKGRKIVRNNLTILKSLLLQIIPDTPSTNFCSSETIDKTLSSHEDDESMFGVSIVSDQLEVSLTSSRNCAVSVDIVDLNFNAVDVIVNTPALELGKHVYTSIPLNPGQYLIRCVRNGIMSVKKIQIR